MEQKREAFENADNDEITLKGLILKGQEWKRYMLGKWKIIFLFGIIGGGLGLLMASLSKPNYVGELTFVLEDSKSSSMGSYAAIASQFGVDLGGGGNVGIFSGENILYFLTSRLMVEKTLLSVVNIDGKDKSLADFYMEIYDYRKNWKDKRLLDIHLSDKTERSKFTVLQDSVLNVIYNDITKRNLVVGKPDKKLSFIHVQCVSLNEYFSKYFIEKLVNEATTFYVETKTKRSKINVDILQARADSILGLLNSKTYSTAVQQDLNPNPVRQVATVGLQVASRDKLMLQTVYSEVVKNLEMSKMSMAQETPIIQIVDTPIMPLKKEKLGKAKGIIFGGILMGFLVVVIIIVRKIYRDILAS